MKNEWNIWLEFEWKRGGLFTLRVSGLYHPSFFFLFTSIHLLDPFLTCCNFSLYLSLSLLSDCVQTAKGIRRQYVFLFCNAHISCQNGQEKKWLYVEHLRLSIQTAISLGVIHSLCAHTHRHRPPRPVWGGVSQPQTQHAPQFGPASTLPEELRPEPLWGRGGAQPAEPGTNERSALLPLQAWLIINTQTFALKSPNEDG